ncbi:hypothetical protein SRHO_G00132180 [Serrasalmus rhombeus]
MGGGRDEESAPFLLLAPLVCFSATLPHQHRHNSKPSFISSHGSRLTGLRQFRSSLSGTETRLHSHNHFSTVFVRCARSQTAGTKGSRQAQILPALATIWDRNQTAATCYTLCDPLCPAPVCSPHPPMGQENRTRVSKWKGRGLVVGSANGDTCSASERHAVPAHPGARRHCMEVEKGIEAPYLGESRHSGPARPRLADW